MHPTTSPYIITLLGNHMKTSSHVVFATLPAYSLRAGSQNPVQRGAPAFLVRRTTRASGAAVP